MVFSSPIKITCLLPSVVSHALRASPTYALGLSQRYSVVCYFNILPPSKNKYSSHISRSQISSMFWCRLTISCIFIVNLFEDTCVDTIFYKSSQSWDWLTSWNVTCQYKKSMSHQSVALKWQTFVEVSTACISCFNIIFRCLNVPMTPNQLLLPPPSRSLKTKIILEFP